MNDTKNTLLDRIVPMAWIVGGAVWTLNGLLGLRAHVGTGGFYAAEGAWLVVHVLVLVGIIGLLRSGVTGGRRWGQAGLGLAGVARVLFIGLEVASIVLGRDNLPPFPIAVVSTGIGMLVAGIAVVRASRWSGWSRFTPLAMGAYPFLFIVPVFAATGERPPDALIAGWGLTMVAIGLALTLRPTPAVRQASSASSSPHMTRT